MLHDLFSRFHHVVYCYHHDAVIVSNSRLTKLMYIVFLYIYFWLIIELFSQLILAITWIIKFKLLFKVFCTSSNLNNFFTNIIVFIQILLQFLQSSYPFSWYFVFDFITLFDSDHCFWYGNDSDYGINKHAKLFWMNMRKLSQCDNHRM